MGAGLVALGACAPARPVPRAGSHPVREIFLDAAPMQLDLAGRVAATWGYNGVVPGPEIRLRVGETLRVPLRNDLPEDTTVHWHGLSIVNAMDGVAGLTQDPVRPGGRFDYEFTVPEAGSFMYHAHVGHQIDRGLYGPLIVEPRREELAYDREYTLMLDDWRDGLDTDRAGHVGHEPTPDEPVPGDEPPSGRVSFGGRRYPLLLVNGRPPDDPTVVEVRRGDRIRLRVMNIGADTGFRFAVDGHRLTVTHTDGMPVRPVTVDTLRLGMGERYDVLLDATTAGAWQVGVAPEGRTGFGRAVLRYTDAAGSPTPPVDARPAELDGRLLDPLELVGAVETRLPRTGTPDRRYALTLAGTTIDGQRHPGADPLPVARGEWVRVDLHNTSAKWHPVHLHGHHFRVVTPGGDGPRKDTVGVPAHGGRVAFDLRAENPGRWLLHCHNHYHMHDGMARVVEYR